MIPTANYHCSCYQLLTTCGRKRTHPRHHTVGGTSQEEGEDLKWRAPRAYKISNPELLGRFPPLGLFILIKFVKVLLSVCLMLLHSVCPWPWGSPTVIFTLGQWQVSHSALASPLPTCHFHFPQYWLLPPSSVLLLLSLLRSSSQDVQIFVSSTTTSLAVLLDDHHSEQDPGTSEPPQSIWT